MIDLLAETRPWVMVLCVLGYLTAAAIILPALYAVFFRSSGATPHDVGAAFGALLVNGGLGVLCLVGSTWLLQFADGINSLQHTKKVRHLEAALAAQKSFWKLCGICAIIVFALFALGLVVGLLGSIRN